MPRYFFSVIDGRDYTDTEGSELPDLAAAQAEAIVTAGEMLRDSTGNVWSGHEWRMNVSDEGGTTVLSLHFTAKLHAC